MSDLEILETKIGETTIKDMSAITFISWLANKINGIPANTADGAILVQRVINPPLGRMTDSDKIEIVRRLQKLNIQIS